MYDVGTNRGCGGTGVWDGRKLLVSKNWKTWKVLANGPIRAVFELAYAPWDAGNGVKIAETKRFTVDAGTISTALRAGSILRRLRARMAN